jgi:hypothetical protein
MNTNMTIMNTNYSKIQIKRFDKAHQQFYCGTLSQLPSMPKNIIMKTNPSQLILDTY